MVGKKSFGQMVRRSKVIGRAVRLTYLISMQAKKSIFGVRQIDLGDQNEGPRVLLIAPAEKRIPVEGWGAVELVLQSQLSYLRRIGYSVDLINSHNPLDWWRLYMRKPRVVICHYDVFTPRALFFCKLFKAKLIAVTHYAYAQQPQKWDDDFERLASHLASADTMIALNPEIAAVFKEINASLRCEIIRNGVITNQFSNQSASKGVICLGKVEPRKSQVDMAKFLRGHEDITFVGEIVDPAFDTLNTAQQKLFVGPWNRNQIETKLGEYSTLVLLSDGEADALVLYEAQAAGLRIVTNAPSLGSQDPTLPWVRVVGSELRDIRALDEIFAILEDPLRETIIAYANKNYSSDAVNENYRAVIDKLISGA